MKLRKHKGNVRVIITFQTFIPAVVAHKGNVGGWEKRGMVLSPFQFAAAEGNSFGGIVNGFLFGRDRNNIVIREVYPGNIFRGQLCPL